VRSFRAVATNVQSGLTWMARGDGRMMPNREAFMNRKMVGIVISMGIFVAGLAGAARAQNSPGVVGMDSALRGAV